MLMKLQSLCIYIFRLIKSMVFLPVLRVTRTVGQFMNPQALIRKLMMSVQEKLKKSVKLKPEKMQDYVEFKYRYIAKSLFVIIPAVLVGAVILFILYAYPWIVSKFFTAVFYEDNKKLPTYSGKVNVLNREANSMIFIGKLENGLKTGPGKILLPDGTMQYEGNFVSGLYEGFGRAYDAQGRLLYEGQFAGGVQEGNGTEYRPESHTPLYRGGFSASQYNGEGVTYYKNGAVEYKGSLVAGERNGQGILYSEEGKVKYKGGFVASQYNGEGILFSDSGAIAYKGTFTGGEMNGQGVQYFADGKPQYSGTFTAGKYDGQGVLNGPAGNVVYEGAFRNGVYSGKGKLFLAGAASYYEGDFMDGLLHGTGKIYANGMKTYEGEFFSGKRHGEGKLLSRNGTVVYQGMFLEDNALYTGLLKKEAKDLTKNFAQKVEYIKFEKDFAYLPEEAGCAFVLNYAELDKVPAVHDIYLWEHENSGMKLLAAKNLTRDKLAEQLGGSVDEINAPAGEVLSRIAEKAGIQGIQENGILTMTGYIVGGYAYDFYFSDQGKRFVALRLKEVTGK